MNNQYIIMNKGYFIKNLLQSPVYYSYDYIVLPNERKIAISMSQNVEAYENPIVERVNGIVVVF